MKSVFSLFLVLAVTVPALAKAQPSCEERVVDMLMEADAIVKYDQEIKDYLQTLKPNEQKVVAAEFQEDLNFRVQELEIEHQKISAECVK
ncbi:hypothetical protein [Bdellovibrio sp. HCB2-146]|uniref:hypothetical protein n=1 Tax=Bdellovibrio sp. HCB2-146 TaxID=3394362 RepID=UPI0039BD456A